MPKVRYRAMTPSGDIVAGVMEAPSQAAAVEELRGHGHYPISTAEASGSGLRAWLARDLLPVRGASRRDLSIVTQELATLLQAGLPLDRALEIVAGLGETRRLHKPLAGVLARLRDGATFADALAADPLFPKIYVSMVRAGEMGSALEATLRRLADYLAKAQAIREMITSALIYPAVLLGTAGLSIIVILVYVLPEFEPLFESAGKALPATTQVIMGLGQFIGAWGWTLALLALALLLALRQGLQRPSFRFAWDRHLLRLPLFGGLLTKIEIERFSRTLGTLLSNGVTLPAALGITKGILSNAVIAKAVGDSAASLREGETLSGKLAQTKVFPAITLDLLRVGEETGTLHEMLLRQADLYERNVKHLVERLLALLVPALTVILGIIVAGLIASMLAAVLSVNDLALQ